MQYKVKNSIKLEKLELHVELGLAYSAYRQIPLYIGIESKIELRYFYMVAKSREDETGGLR